MYKRILLAYDGSAEGRTALREGALLAKKVHAKVFLLSVIAETATLRMAEGNHPGTIDALVKKHSPLLEDGVEKLRKLGFSAQSKLVSGEPVREIALCAQQFGADLVVVGHRRSTMLERWWSGTTGANLSDYITCSLLIARNEVNDVNFEAECQLVQAE